MRLRLSGGRPDAHQHFEELHDYEQFFELSADMLAILDWDGRVRLANSAFDRIMGLSHDRLPGKLLEELFLDEDREAAREHIRELTETGESTVLLRARNVHGDIRALRCSSRAGPLLSSIYLSARDVSDQLVLRGELESVVADLHRSNRDLEQFAYLASHDLQAPLRTVRGFHDLLLDRIQANGGVMDEDATRYRQLVESAVDRMDKLIRGLLAFSRLETRATDHVTVDLEELCQQTVRALAESIEESGAEIRIGDLPSLPADPDQISSVLQNLIQNAIKYRHPERPPIISVAAKPERHRWRITVTDNGIGVDPRLCDRAFQMFKQLHPEGTYEGIGLGLSIARRIVEHHGGEIRLTSDGESGTAVAFTLPGPIPESINI